MTRPATYTGRQQASFTLPEVMISALIIVIVLGALLSAFVSARRSNALAQNYLMAQQIARSEAERLLTNSYSAIGGSTAVVANTMLAGCRMIRSVAETNLRKNVVITLEWIAPSSSKREALTNYITICNPN